MSIKQEILDVMKEEQIDPNSLVKKYSRKVTGCGTFYCRQCKKAWTSHHAVCVIDLKGLKIPKRWRQKCQTCQKYAAGPSWKPDIFKKMVKYVCKSYKLHLETGGKRQIKQITKKPAQPTKPHRYDLCEACVDGICTALRATTDPDILAQGIQAITL